jgi:hypothetical protein
VEVAAFERFSFCPLYIVNTTQDVPYDANVCACLPDVIRTHYVELHKTHEYACPGKGPCSRVKHCPRQLNGGAAVIYNCQLFNYGALLRARYVNVVIITRLWVMPACSMCAEFRTTDLLTFSESILSVEWRYINMNTRATRHFTATHRAMVTGFLLG